MREVTLEARRSQLVVMPTTKPECL
jgi:hypothetical protein